MADTVRYMMEEMVPELEDFVKQQYFSKQEVKQIVKRRQDFEYLLKRKAALKEDFLRYIEYESKLEALRQHRRQALGLEGKKRTLADYAITRRIHFVFERAVRKFRSDVSLWTAWLEFCRSSNSNRRLGRVVARALQIHPTEPGLWVYAAAWEFEANANPAAARALMQQGLRMCRHSEKMWLSYFDMELMYVEKLVARRRILGLDVPEPDQQDSQQPAVGQKRPRAAAAEDEQRQQQQQQNGLDEGRSEPGSEDDGEGPEEANEAGGAAAAAEQPSLSQVLSQQQQGSEQQQPDPMQDAQAAVKAVLTGAVARLVYQQALKAAAAAASKGGGSSNYLKYKPGSSSSGSNGSTGISSSRLGFRAGFLEVLSRYHSPGVAKIRQEVLESIRQDFAQDPAAADLLARVACDPTDVTAAPEAVHAAVQEYTRLLDAITSSTNTTPTTTPAAAAAAAVAGDSSKGRSSKRQKTVQEGGNEEQSQAEAAGQLPRESVVELYRLYSGYLMQRLQALLVVMEQAEAAAAVAQQLFKVLLAAHAAGAADEQLYLQWVQLASQLKQHKVALRAARLATQAHPSSASAWCTRLDLEQETLSSKVSTAGNSSSTDQQQLLLSVVKQALKQVPSAEAVPLWEKAFQLTKAAEEGKRVSQLAALQRLMLDAVTKAAVKGPARGGLGAVAACCLAAVWEVSGAAAARKLWQQLMLLPSAGGDMFRAMIEREQAQAAAAAVAAASDVATGTEAQQELPVDAVKRIRAVYDAWGGAYGGTDAELWVQYALFEQQQSKAGPGKVYWKAVKALEDPEEFITEYRQRVGLV